MKNLLILVFVFLTTLAFSQSRGFVEVEIAGVPTELYSESYALVIGVSDYTNGWPSLPGVKTDVALVKTALEANGFTVTQVLNPTSLQLQAAFSDFIKNYGSDAHPNARLLFYYAGHGHTIATNYGDTLGYIVPTDACLPTKDEAGFQSKAMPMSQIEIYAKTIQAKHALFLFDACFAGSLFNMTRAIPDIISTKTKQPVRQFITSGSKDETVPDKSIFREQFITAITTDEADANNDSYVTGAELGEYLQTNVTNYSRNTQHPQYGKIRNSLLDKGDYVFALSTETNDNTDNKIVVTTTGSLQITTKNVFGKFYIDDIYRKTLTAGQTETFSDLTTGVHVLKIAATPVWTEKIMIIGGQTTYINADKEEEIIVPVTTGTLIVNSTNITAKLYIDDIYYQTLKIGNNTISNIEKGTYTLKADTWITTATITATKTTTVTATKTEEIIDNKTIKDGDGNTYTTVVIGTQTWLKENLKTTKYCDGTAIPNVTDNTAWTKLTTAAYCWYENDYNTYGKIYGALYNWYAVDKASNGNKNICPTGYHVPTDAEWKKLEMYCGMTQSEADDTGWRGTTEGTELKAKSGWNNRGNGTDDYGFAALPGGYRYGSDGTFNYVGNYGSFWSSTAFDASSAWYRYLYYNYAYCYRNANSMRYGFSVRCLRD